MCIRDRYTREYYRYCVGYYKYWSHAECYKSYTNVIYLIDELDPPIVLEQDDVLVVTWEVWYPKSSVTSNFWRMLKTLMGTDDYPDFGMERSDCGAEKCTNGYKCGSPPPYPNMYDNVHEVMKYRIVFGDGSATGITNFVKKEVWTNETGIYIRLVGYYTEKSTPKTLSSVDLYLCTDTSTGGGTYVANVQLFTSIPLNPVTVDIYETAIVEVLVKVPYPQLSSS